MLYDEKHDGGGSWMAPHFADTVSQYRRRYSRVCEFCSGPGFIGFEILNRDLCDSLCLIDINPEVEENICKTNPDVTFYHSDCFDEVPDHELFDLIVANPPHANEQNRREGLRPRDNRIWQDLDWAVHRKFYSQVSQYMMHNAIVVMIENSQYSSVNDFWNMSWDGGLEMIDSYPAGNPKFYYIILRNQRVAHHSHV